MRNKTSPLPFCLIKPINKLSEDPRTPVMTHSCRREVSCEGTPWWPPRPWWCTGKLTGKTRWCSPCWADWPRRTPLNWVERTWRTETVVHRSAVPGFGIADIVAKSRALCGCASFYWPVLWGGDEKRGQLAQNNHAGVEEEAAQDGQGQQAGWGSVGVQLPTGASSPHHDGQQGHHEQVTEQELEVSQGRPHLETHIHISNISLCTFALPVLPVQRTTCSALALWRLYPRFLSGTCVILVD